MSFVQWVRVRRMIEEVALEPKQTFWNMNMNLLLDAAIVEWAKVFGSHDTEDTHWKNVIPADQHEATRAALLKHLGLTPEQWKAEREGMIAYRNQLVSHHDLEATVAKIPRFDVPLQAAFFMFDRIRAITDQEWLGNIPTALDSWSKTVAGNMRVIVCKAHSATKTLPSNVLDN